MGRSTNIRMAGTGTGTGIGALALLMALSIELAGPALAHGSRGIVQLAVHGRDGAATVRAFVTYVDNDPVQKATLRGEAVSSAGPKLALSFKPEATPGWYVATVPSWTVRWQARVSLLAPATGSGSATVTTSSGGVISSVDDALGPQAGSAPASAPKSGGSGPNAAVIAGLSAGVVLAAGGTVLVVGRVRRRAATS